MNGKKRKGVGRAHSTDAGGDVGSAASQSVSVTTSATESPVVAEQDVENLELGTDVVTDVDSEEKETTSTIIEQSTAEDSVGRGVASDDVWTAEKQEEKVQREVNVSGKLLGTDWQVGSEEATADVKESESSEKEEGIPESKYSKVVLESSQGIESSIVAGNEEYVQSDAMAKGQDVTPVAGSDESRNVEENDDPIAEVSSLSEGFEMDGGLVRSEAFIQLKNKKADEKKEESAADIKETNGTVVKTVHAAPEESIVLSNSVGAGESARTSPESSSPRKVGDAKDKLTVFSDVYKRLRAEERKLTYDLQKALVRDGVIVGCRSNIFTQKDKIATALRETCDVIRGSHASIMSAVRDVNQIIEGYSIEPRQKLGVSGKYTGAICSTIGRGIELLEHSYEVRGILVSFEQKQFTEELNRLDGVIAQVESDLKAAKKIRSREDRKTSCAKHLENLNKLKEQRAEWKELLGIVEKEIQCLNKEERYIEEIKGTVEKYGFIEKAYFGCIRFNSLYVEILNSFLKEMSAFEGMLRDGRSEEGPGLVESLQRHCELFEKHIASRLAREHEIEAQLRAIETAVTAQFTLGCEIYNLASACNETRREEDKCLIADLSLPSGISGKLSIQMRDLYNKETEHNRCVFKSRNAIKSAVSELCRLTNSQDFLDHSIVSIRSIRRALASPGITDEITRRDDIGSSLSRLNGMLANFAIVFSIANKNYAEANELLNGWLLGIQREGKIDALRDMATFHDILQCDTDERFADGRGVVGPLQFYGLPSKRYSPRLAESKEALIKHSKNITFTAMNAFAAARASGVELSHVVKDHIGREKSLGNFCNEIMRLDAATKENAKEKKQYLGLITQVIENMAQDQAAREKRIHKIITTFAAALVFVFTSALASYGTMLFLPVLGTGVWLLAPVAAIVASAGLLVTVSVLNFAVNHKGIGNEDSKEVEAVGEEGKKIKTESTQPIPEKENEKITDRAADVVTKPVDTSAESVPSAVQDTPPAIDVKAAAYIENPAVVPLSTAAKEASSSVNAVLPEDQGQVVQNSNAEQEGEPGKVMEGATAQHGVRQPITQPAKHCCGAGR